MKELEEQRPYYKAYTKTALLSLWDVFSNSGVEVNGERSVNKVTSNVLTSRTSILLWDAVEQWLRHCATNHKVAGSIPDGVIGIFNRHNPSGRTMTLGSTQTLTEMSTRNISWG
jgi:hypothetical protein